MNKPFLLSAALAIVVSSAASHAADLPAAAPVYKAPAAAMDTWTGFYAGGNAGYGWQGRTATFTPNDPGATTLGPFIGGGPAISYTSSGALGGLQVGYNWQFDRNWVAGFETDFDFANIKGSGTATYPGPGGNPVNSMVDDHTKWFGTVRGRLGYLPANNLLLYGTGGFAYGKVQQTASIADPTNAGFGATNGNCIGLTTCYAGTSSRTATGWTAGAGAEYAFMSKWTFKAEYLYVNLGSNSFIAPLANASGTSSMTANFGDTTFHVVRGGINYRF